MCGKTACHLVPLFQQIPSHCILAQNTDWLLNRFVPRKPAHKVLLHGHSSHINFIKDKINQTKESQVCSLVNYFIRLWPNPLLQNAMNGSGQQAFNPFNLSLTMQQEEATESFELHILVINAQQLVCHM